MTPAVSLDEYLADPIGRYFAGASWAHAWPAPNLVCFLLFGRPNVADMRLLTRCFEVELQPRSFKLVSICDSRRLESVDLEAYDHLHTFVETHGPQLSRAIDKQAVLRAAHGFIGAVNSGFWEVRKPPYSVRVFEDVREAYAWLEEGSLRLFDELSAIHAAATAQSPLLLQVRAALQGKLAEATLEGLAVQVGLSERTLQRRLSEEGTSFGHEVARERLRAAQELLRGTDLKVEEVALRVGCASTQHLAQLFRKHVDMTPGEWREQATGVKRG